MVLKRQSRDEQRGSREGSMLIGWIGCVSSNDTKILVLAKINPNGSRENKDKRSGPYVQIIVINPKYLNK